MRKQLFISIVIALICLYWAFRGISFPHLISGASKWPKESGLLWLFASIHRGWFFRTWRWQILIRPIYAIPIFDLLGPLILGYFANNILPFRMGELVRAHIIGQKFKISRTASLGTILLERLCDMIAFLSTFVVAALFFSLSRALQKHRLL